MTRTLVTSSQIKSIGYDPETQKLEVEFNKGIYEYSDVPQRVYEELMAAPSIGAYFNDNVRFDYEYRKL